MAKQTTQAAASASIVTIGLDIGYGMVKAVTAGAEPLLFPSVWGHARNIKFNAEKLAIDYPGDQITDDSGAWFVGSLANSQLTAGEILRLRGRTANEADVGNAARARLAKVALGKLLPGRRNGEAVHVRIATGLPVDHMSSAPALKAALIGQHRVQTDSADFVANIVDVIVMPQPYGTIYSEMLTPAGDLNPCHTATRTGVVDVGTYTVDLALDDSGEYIDSESGSVESGVYLAQQTISQLISDKHGQIPKAATVEEVLRTGCLRAKGKVIDYSADVQEALEPIRSAAISKMGELWKAGLDVHVIYLSGGGASLVEKAVKAAGFGQAQLVENAQIANARGYLNYALFKAK